VLLQFFPDSGNLIVAAADSGLTGQPDWYLNLKAHPQAHAEVKGSTVDVRAEAPQKPPRPGRAYWPPRRTVPGTPGKPARLSPLLPLVPPHGSHNAT